jgi:hypothetical protein
MPTHPLRDSLRLHGTPFSSAGSSCKLKRRKYLTLLVLAMRHEQHHVKSFYFLWINRKQKQVNGKLKTTFFLIWGPEIAWLVRTCQDWLVAFETLVDHGVLVAVDVEDFVAVVVVAVVGLGYPQNQWKRKIRA